MGQPTNAEFRSKIEECERTIEETLDRWERIPPERKPYMRLGLNARAIGVYSVSLGELSVAREWFAKASDWYRGEREKVRGELDEPQMLLWTLLTAVLSGDDGAMATAAGSAADVANPDPEYFTHFDRCLAGLIDGDDETVLAAAADLEASEAAASELDYYTGLGAACEAIVRENSARLDEALAEVLRRHEERVPKLGATMDDALVCIEATALCILAKKRGLPVESLDAVGSEYVPSTILK